MHKTSVVGVEGESLVETNSSSPDCSASTPPRSDDGGMDAGGSSSSSSSTNGEVSPEAADAPADLVNGDEAVGTKEEEEHEHELHINPPLTPTEENRSSATTSDGGFISSSPGFSRER